MSQVKKLHYIGDNAFKDTPAETAGVWGFPNGKDTLEIILSKPVL